MRAITKIEGTLRTRTLIAESLAINPPKGGSPPKERTLKEKNIFWGCLILELAMFDRVFQLVFIAAMTIDRVKMV
jgi:hypothetical protein